MDEQDNVTSVLETLQFSASLSDAHLEELAAMGVVREFPTGAVLFHENSLNDELMIVISGSVALEINVAGRGNVRILSLGPGEMVAWSAILGGGRMTTSAVAQQDSQVVAISARKVLARCESDHAFGYHIMRRVADSLANRLVATRLQLLDVFGAEPPQIPLES